MEKIMVGPDVYWVGQVEDEKITFHRFILEKGTTYNSYLLMTEKPTLIDTIDMKFGGRYVETVSQLVDLQKISYVVVNHVEPDHSGALPALMAKAKDAKIVTSRLAVDVLKDMFRLHGREFIVIEDGQTLDIGGKTLQFFETPFLHTEETMMTYAVEDQVLFTCDVFSSHVSTHNLFNDEAEPNLTSNYLDDVADYYEMIIAPHRPYVQDMLEKVGHLPIQVIAPSHGFILRDSPEKTLELYKKLSTIPADLDKKVALIYSTMTGNTEKIAKSLAEGLMDFGIETALFNLKKADEATVLSAIAEADGVLIGSSTQYGDLVGGIEEFLLDLADTDQFAGKLGAAFGSYGWSGEAIAHIEEYLAKAGFTVVDQSHIVRLHGVDTPFFPLRVKFAREEGLKRAEQAGRLFAEQLLTMDHPVEKPEARELVLV